MKNSWIIRQAQTSDSSALQTCMQSAYAFYQTRLNGLRLPPMDVDYLEEIQNYPTWVAVNEGQVVGGLILIFTDKCATIANVAVHPENQGQGLGRRLMDFVDSIAREKGYSDLRLSTHVLLHENLSLYLHLGWQEVRRDTERINLKKKI